MKNGWEGEHNAPIVVSNFLFDWILPLITCLTFFETQLMSKYTLIHFVEFSYI